MQYTYEGPGFSISNALLQATGLAHVGLKVKQSLSRKTIYQLWLVQILLPMQLFLPVLRNAEPEPVEPKIFETKFPFY